MTMEMAAEISEAMHDATFSVSKLNLPSSAGVELINTKLTSSSVVSANLSHNVSISGLNL